MSKSFFGEVQEYSGPVPAGGYKCVIEEIERGVTGERAQNPGAKRYAARLRVVEPKKYGGSVLMDYFTIGTEDDPKARDQATWNTSLGAKRLFRLLKRAGVAAKDGDDEEWMDAAQGQEVCAHVQRERDETGQFRNRVNGDYYKESDEDFVGVGELLEAPSADGRGGPRSARGGNGQAKQARGGQARKPPADEDEEDKPPTRKAKAAADEDDDEEDERETKPTKASAAKGKGAKGGRLPKDDEDDDDED